MKKQRLLVLLAFTTVLLLVGCGLLPDGELPIPPGKEPMMVDVMLQEAPGITVVGENPVRVEAGSDASFAVQVDEAYQIEQISSGAVYEDGMLTLTNVRFPTTVQIETRELPLYNLSLYNKSWQGEVTSNVPLGGVREGTQVTLTVTPKKGQVFTGFSTGNVLMHGGTVISLDSKYTFTMTEDVRLYANYTKVGNGQLVIYDSNGGNEVQQYYIFSEDSPYIGPNVWANKGQMTKDGHVLYGYNTKADGSGTYYGTGWSVIMPADGETALTLYAQWMPVTETSAFTYTRKNNNVVITGYKGNHETVVIPETIEGVPVTRIFTGAFKGAKIKTLYLSRNLRIIDDKAFENCKNLTTLYFCDTPSTVTDASFSGCSELQTLYMLACIDPRYSTSNNGTYKIKYQRLLTAEGKKIIFHAGSNVSYGIDIPTIEKKLGGEYAGVNFGCNQGTSSVFFTEVATAHMNAGDILVLCPEYHKYQYGYNEMNTTTWQIFEGAYNAYADVDIRNYTKVFTSFSTFNNNRYSSTVRTYEQYCTSGGAPAVTQKGEYNVNHNGQTTDLKNQINGWRNNGNAGTLNIDTGLVTASYNVNLNKAIDRLIAKGCKVYISFASTLNISLNKNSQSAATQQNFKNVVVKTFPGATVISDPATYILDQSYFFNSYYHLSTTSSVYRAELLAKDILAQFAKER